MDDLPIDQRLRLWADELHSIASEGMRWSADDPYNVRRWERLIRIAAELFAVQDARTAEEIERIYRGDLGHHSPYLGGDAATFDRDERILLIQRRDTGLWAMPGGVLEVGETPAEGAAREAREETGIVVKPVALSGVYDSRCCGSRSNYHLYHLVFLCRPLDPGAQPATSNETLDAGWYAEAGLPPLHPGHGRRIADAFRRWRRELSEAVFDPVAEPGGE